MQWLIMIPFCVQAQSPQHGHRDRLSGLYACLPLLGRSLCDGTYLRAQQHICPRVLHSMLPSQMVAITLFFLYQVIYWDFI